MAPTEQPSAGGVLLGGLRFLAIAAAVVLLAGVVWLFTEYAQLPAAAADSDEAQDAAEDAADDQALADAAAQESMAAALAQSAAEAAAAANVPIVLDDLDWVTVDLMSTPGPATCWTASTPSSSTTPATPAPPLNRTGITSHPWRRRERTR